MYDFICRAVWLLTRIVLGLLVLLVFVWAAACIGFVVTFR